MRNNIDYTVSVEARLSWCVSYWKAMLMPVTVSTALVGIWYGYIFSILEELYEELTPEAYGEVYDMFIGDIRSQLGANWRLPPFFS